MYDDGTGAVKTLVVSGEQRGAMWEYGDYGWVPEYHLVDGKAIQHTFLTWFSRWLADTEEGLEKQRGEAIAIPPDQTSFGILERKLKKFPRAVLEATQLEDLSLSSAHLTAIPPEIARLTRLRDLRLSNNALTALPPEIGTLSQLEELRLGRNRIKALPEEMERLTKLKRLDLNDNALRSIPPVIARLPALAKLTLRGNRIPKSDIEAFRAAHPGVEVVF